jgi:arylsulfatase A
MIDHRLFYCVLLALTLIGTRPSHATSNRPNIILIVADDLGYECITANGGQSYQTPVLDRLAAEGIRFEHCHSQPLCTPTRVQLMTGRYNVRNYINFGTLPRTETTFAHTLKQAGYATAICGKWQLGKEPDSPQHFGFDEAFLWQHTRRPPRYANPGLERNAAEKDYTQGEYGPTLINDFALDFITWHKEQPFFLYYPMILTHDPFQPTPDSPNWDPKTADERQLKDPKHFSDMVAYMDKMIGRVDAKLEELGIRDNTVLIFLGDNGTHSTITSQFKGKPYWGGKGSTTARGTHVPLIVSWPALITTGRVNTDLICTADFLPTLCHIAGSPLPTGLDGITFFPQLQGQPGTPRPWIYSWYSPRQKMDLTVQECVFNHHYKLYRDGSFFDLRQDPFETGPINPSSLIADQISARQELQSALARYANVRPTALDEAFAKTRRDLKPPKAKKNAPR